MKTLLAVDGSAYTERMLAYVAAHPELLGAGREISVLTVTTAVPPLVTGYIDKASLQTYYSDQAEETFKTVRAFIDQQGWKASYLTKVGNAADCIAATAKEGGYDLVVMGSHGHSALGSLVMGSVTSRVLANCETALLIVR